MSGEAQDRLSESARVQEQPFRSQVPILGPLIARFRELWNSVSTKWYVRPLLEQQNHFNQLLVQHLQEQEAHLREQSERLIAQDREQVNLAHDLAEVSAQLVHTNRLLNALEERLTRLEAAKVDD